jgi:hypothetical protein
MLGGKPVKIMITFNGHFHGLSADGNQRAAGSYREEVAFEDGSGETCTTNTQAWTAEVESQGSQEASTPAAGAYARGGGYTMLYVSPNGSQVQDVSRETELACSTGANITSAIAIEAIPVMANTTFGETQVETGLINGKPVKITITFNGHFHGLNGSGVQRAAGTYREEVGFEDGSGETCTTDTQAWFVELESEDSQQAQPPAAGAYARAGGYTLFHVSTDSSQVEQVSRPTELNCSTGVNITSAITVGSIAIVGNTTFTDTAVESGKIEGKNVTITITFNGHFHGLSADGNQRAAGTYRENVAFEGSSETCTSNVQAWTAET